MDFIQGFDRNQLVMMDFESNVAFDSWARVVDWFVDALPMKKLGFKLVKGESTPQWRQVSRKGEEIELVYKNGNRVASVEFSTIDKCAGRARKSKLHPIRVNRECYILSDERKKLLAGRHGKGEGIQPVIGYDGNVYPCWAGPYPDTRPLGNIYEDHLSTILGREKAYLAAFGNCVDRDWNGRTDICGFCVDVSTPCLG